jgi:DNA (cytosine-5)-methyltransferase 1
MEKTVVELFAGVGGFRVGLNEVKLNETGKLIEKKNFKFVWANQWEPSTKVQHAFNCYQTRFGESPSHVNQDISIFDKSKIPNHSLLVGGFPCQDYSVARSLSKEKGIEGKKGVLWWEIFKIVTVKKPPFILLENVDRLLKSPSKQRGRDFGIMLRSLNDLGYGVEWRVINAAEYGHPQKRRRVFIFAFHMDTNFYNTFVCNSNESIFLDEQGFFMNQFPVNLAGKIRECNISTTDYTDLVDVSNRFEFDFQNTGFSINHVVHTAKTEAIRVSPITLSDIIETGNVADEFYLSNEKIAKFNHLRGSKKIERVNKETGISYNYSEGAMSPYDSLDLPGRTMLTSEGSVNRSTHIILDPTVNKLRLITPVEAERLNQFPDNWTNTMPTRSRYFMMGNALVTGLVKKMGKTLSTIMDNE